MTDPALRIACAEECGKKKLPFKITQDRFGFTATCPLGLWSVSALSRKKVLAEAWHYYAQYKAGGEYRGQLGGGEGAR